MRQTLAMSQRTDFETLTPPNKPNWRLVAPKGLCKKATPQAEAPVYAIAVEALWDRLVKTVAAEPRVRIHEQDKRALYLDFTQTSFFFRFPDRVSIQLIAAGDARSTLAIYSRSKYGHSDLGVNAKRVERLLAALQTG
jgi:uncharacterized protein (DUF1499 family)